MKTHNHNIENAETFPQPRRFWATAVVACDGLFAALTRTSHHYPVDRWLGP